MRKIILFSFWVVLACCQETSRIKFVCFLLDRQCKSFSLQQKGESMLPLAQQRTQVLDVVWLVEVCSLDSRAMRPNLKGFS